MSDFRHQFDLESRLNESTRIRQKYAGRVPVICTRSKTEKVVPSVQKIKYLVPEDLTMAQFMYVIRNRMQLRSDQSLYMFVNGGVMVRSSALLKQIDSEHKNDDGFLYIEYAGESTFGN